jgi:hypothetical protein
MVDPIISGGVSGKCIHVLERQETFWQSLGARNAPHQTDRPTTFD